MAFLIAHLAPWLLIAAAFAAFSGWSFQTIRSRPRLDELERERDKLRAELVGMLTGELPLAARAPETDRELETLRTRESIAHARALELERALSEMRDQRDQAAARAAEVERARENAPVALLTHAPDAAPALAAAVGDLHSPLAWRLRYFEARTRYLESEARRRNVEHATAREALRTEIATLREAPAPTGEGEEMQALKWRIRYLESQARTRETSAAAPDAEQDRRRAWRMRYLEARARHIENAALDRLNAAHARIADLESAQGDGKDGDVQRLAWRARYLDARVRHLEQKLAAAPASSAQSSTSAAPAVQETPLPMETPPLVPQGQEMRPEGLAAPRNGVRDDLTLIEGVSPLWETKLNALGLFHFDQVAGWTRANIAWVDHYLRLRGRIVEEHWVEQARDLARGAGGARRRYFESEMA